MLPATTAQPDVLPGQLRRARASSAASDSFYTVPDARRTWPAGSRRTIIDPLTGAAVPEQHHSAVALLAAGAAGAAEQLVSGAEQHRGAGQLSAGPHAAAGSGPVHDPRRSARSARSGRSSAATPTPTYDNRTNSNLLEIGDASSSRTRRTGRSRTRWAVRRRTSSTSSASAASRRAPIRAGIACPQADVDFLRLTGVVHRPARHPARVSERSASRATRAPAAPSTPTRRATSRCGTSATPRPGSPAATR